MIENQDRGAWSSKLGFILAGAGSAIGLGNIWRFPTIVGENGGAVFVIVYLLCVLLLGLPVMIAELSIGRKTKKNPVGAIIELAPGSSWKYVGYLGVLTGLIIFSWYSVIAGWVVGYLYKTVAGEFNNIVDPAITGTIFENFVADPVITIFLTAFFIGLTSYVLLKGVSGGIEKTSKILMPLLLVLLVVLAIRAMTLDGASAGLDFYLSPDFSKLNIKMVLAAMGQALFSLSLGMGTMITYGSYLSKKEDIVSSAVWVCGFDTGIAILSGFVVLPAVFAMGIDPSTAGPGLIFQALPGIFSEMPGGQMFGVGLFTLIGIAALTSTVSILEVPVAYVVDELKWSRRKSVISMALVSFVLAVPSALSNGASDFFGNLFGEGQSYFTVMSTVFGDLTLALGSLFIAVFVGWIWKSKNVFKEVEEEGNVFPMKGVYEIMVKYVSPIFIAIVFGYTVWDQILK